MKRYFLTILLISIFLLFGGCEQPQPSSMPTTEPAPTQPVWVQEIECPSYDVFFAEDRIYEEKENPCAWTVTTGSAEAEYVLSLDAEAGSLYVTGKTLETPEQVYASGILRECNLLGCDGRFAYLTRQGEHAITTQILQLELLTGELETLVQGGSTSGYLLLRLCGIFCGIPERGCPDQPGISAGGNRRFAPQPQCTCSSICNGPPRKHPWEYCL